MTDPKCAVCGHVNLTSATACGMCDARLGDPGGPRAEGFDPYAAGAGEIPSPQFKGAGDVIAPTLQICRKHFVLVGILAAVTTLPAALLQYAVVRAVTAESADEAAAAILTPLAVILLSFVSTAFLSGALVYGVIDIQRAGAASAADCLFETRAFTPGPAAR